MPFRVNERIDERREGRDKNRGDPDDGCVAEEDGKQRDHPGDDPYIARETVGVIPVILVVKRPRDADAHGVVMAAFGQIIADGDEEQADENHAETRDVDGEAQRAQVYGQAGEQADGGADPQDELRHLFGDILLFGIGAQHDGAEELHGEDEQREADHCERAAGIVVHRAAEIEMGGHALGQAIPQGEAEKHRQQDDDAGNKQGAFRNGFHGCLLSVERARA